MIAVLGAIGFWLLVGAPFLVTLLAFLDVARRPAWAWAMAGRRQAVWMAVLGGSAITWLGGAFVAVVYLFTAFRDVRAAERGDLSAWIDTLPPPDGSDPAADHGDDTGSQGPTADPDHPPES